MSVVWPRSNKYQKWLPAPFLSSQTTSRAVRLLWRRRSKTSAEENPLLQRKLVPAQPVRRHNRLSRLSSNGLRNLSTLNRSALERERFWDTSYRPANCGADRKISPSLV